MILLPLSGGTDSVAALWHLRDRDVRVFHLVMGYHWRRAAAELHAARAAMHWMIENGHFAKTWRYSEVELPLTSPWGMCVDIPALGVWIGAILQTEPDVDSVCRVIIGDGTDHGQGERKENPDVEASFVVAEAFAGRPVHHEFPFEHTLKADLYAQTPRDLIELAISCWGPALDVQTGRWRQCGRCDKCEECRRCGLPTP